jgi:hypothetical protein
VLLAQDYASGIFVHDAFGTIPGTLPLSAINLDGTALPPVPTIVVNFRSFGTGCPQPTNCTVVVSDGALQQGQGMHGSFSRGETFNFMAAVGPDFRHGFVDDAPASNADIGVTLVHLLGLEPHAKGKLVGRVLSEASPGGQMPAVARRVLRSSPASGLETVLQFQTVGETRYFDAAGFPGRTLGLVQHERRAARSRRRRRPDRVTLEPLDRRHIQDLIEAVKDGEPPDVEAVIERKLRAPLARERRDHGGTAAGQHWHSAR